MLATLPDVVGHHDTAEDKGDRQPVQTHAHDSGRDGYFLEIHQQHGDQRDGRNYGQGDGNSGYPGHGNRSGTHRGLRYRVRLRDVLKVKR